MLFKGELSAKDLSLVEYIYPEKLSLFDYLATNGEVFFDDYPRLREKEKTTSSRRAKLDR